MDNITMNMTQWMELLTTLNRIANALEIIAYNDCHTEEKFTSGTASSDNYPHSTNEKTFFEMYK